MQQQYAYQGLLSDQKMSSIYRVDTLDKEMIHIPGGTGKDFISLLTIVCNLKFVNCPFLNFPFNIFGPSLTLDNELWKVKLWMRGKLQHVKLMHIVVF